MATNNGKNKRAAKAEWKGYHKINLTVEQSALFETEYLPTPLLWSDIDILVNNGYKFSLSWDSYNSGVSASLYAQDKKMEWAGYTLSAWSGDAETATKLLLFKHYVVCEEQWEIVPYTREGASVKWG
jgi:hypothetical protein